MNKTGEDREMKKREGKTIILPKYWNIRFNGSFMSFAFKIGQ